MKISRLDLNFSFSFSLLVLASLLVGLTLGMKSARADEYGPNHKAFSRLIRESYEECVGTRTCSKPLRLQRIYSQSAPTETPLSSDQLTAMQKISVHQAAIWADTILEGDYEADGLTRLDHVEAVYLVEELVGYRVTYSERAWDLSGYECEYDHEDKETLKGCYQGRIQESSFISPDFMTWLRDEHAYAEFVN